jgi:hypothetical protein
MNAMSINPKDWLAMEQIMENGNHSLFQLEVTEPECQTPQLLLLSSHAAHGTSSSTTFLAIISIGGKRGIPLVDCCRTNTFLDYSFASKLTCSIDFVATKKVAIAGGGHLETSAIIRSAPYTIWHESFTNDFKLLPLRGYNIILDCD